MNVSNDNNNNNNKNNNENKFINQHSEKKMQVLKQELVTLLILASQHN